jgi:hypothetical protein
MIAHRPPGDSPRTAHGGRPTSAVKARPQKCPGSFRKHPGRMVLGLCSAHLFWATATCSDKWLTSFGQYQEIRLEQQPVALSAYRLSKPARSGFVAAYAEPARLAVFSPSDPIGLTPVKTADMSNLSGCLVCADIDADGSQECVSLAASGRSLSIFHLADAQVREELHPLDVRPQRCAVGDINSDGWPDILLYGQTMTGIATLLGSSAGRIAPGPLLLPDISTGDLCLLDLNGDRLIDLLLLDWLSEKLVVEYGLGRGIFAEQTRLQLPSEPGRLSAIAVTVKRTCRIVITLPRAHAVAHVVRNVYGEFSIKETIDVHGRPRDAWMTLVNGDPFPDLVCLTSSGVFVSIGATPLGFDRGTMFGVGADATSWTMADQQMNRMPDIVLGDRNGKRFLVLRNSRSISPPDVDPEYAVGSMPVGVICNDVNQDGLVDVVVANNRSATLSVLLNAGGGRLDGQVALDVADQPLALYGAGSSVTQSTLLVTTHPSTSKVGVTYLLSSGQVSRSFTVPTCSDPVILRAEEDHQDGRLSVLVGCGTQKRGEPYIALLQQLSGAKFIERSFRANLPVSITVFGTGAGYGAASRNLAFVSRFKDNGGSALYTAPSPDTGEDMSLRPVLSLVDSASSIQAVVLADFDQDGNDDMALLRSQPDDAVGIAYGKGEGKIDHVTKWWTVVKPDLTLGFELYDVNNDRLPDIVWVSRQADSVFVMTGKLGRAFAAPKSVCPAFGVSGFTVGHITDAPTPDLVLCRGNRHSVSLISSPFAP